MKIRNDQKLRYSSCMVMVIISHDFKALPSLIWLSHSTTQNFINFSSFNFFGLGIPLFIFLLFLETGKNYIMSIIITIVRNITVLRSQNIIFFRFFMPMSHGVFKKTLPSASPPPTSLSPSRFSPGLFVALQEMLDQPSTAVIRLFAKDNAFSKTIRFFLLAHCWSVLILLFCL